ncbi:hypothetical protein [Halomicrobium sp. LC1Hm]|uniref:hypothetical protein n=1 Tax=Halomicrobium sp. LC1Hm TaxID=2610902 RepID=UPI0012983830|nr:hypothetical protein [Halomicrobium sp. LC1Hm]QGA82606.1 Membrane associated protein with Zn zinger domain [Halomicrobium sp. LC1Hm]
MSVLGALRNPAHTGPRRCVPCTLVNVAILWLAVNVVVVLGQPLAGVAVLVVGLVVIWLRGYLVPYTPQFAPRLVAASPIPTTWFHDTNEPGSIADRSRDGDRLLGELRRAGLLDADDERVYLDPDFEGRWHTEMDRLASQSLDDLADELASVPSVPSARPVEQDGQEWLAVGGQTALVARHVAIAELGAVAALEPHVDAPADRLAMARPLREFLTDCPACGSAFDRSSEVSCCGGYTNPREKPRETLVCPECEQRFLRLPEPE